MHSNLPPAFIQRLQNQIGEQSHTFLEALGNKPNVSVRLNPMKPCVTEWDQSEVVPWCPKGRYLPEKPVFTLDPLFHAGCYYPQEASSMVLDWIVRNVCSLPKQPVILDLCGAPGGKSTLLASFLNGEGLLVANEVIRNRAVILQESIIKWGAPNCIVTRNDPADFSSLTSLFDLIVVDAPCSGEGMFRKEPRAVDEWSESNARMCAARQQRILTDAWPALKEGGYLIYSTCTFNPDENEGNIEWFSRQFGAEVLKMKLPVEWGSTEISIGEGNGHAFYPHRVKGEGFFVTVLLKNKPEQPLTLKFSGKKQLSKKIPESLNTLIRKDCDWYFDEKMDEWHAFPSRFLSELNLLGAKLNVMKYGVLIGRNFKKGGIPAHNLAMSTEFNRAALPVLDLTKIEALRYLKGESLHGLSAPKGYVLLTFQDIPLGFVKNIGTRMNNLYPSEWRIRMNLPG